MLRFFGDGGDDRLLLVNLGRDLHLDPAPEPLLAPPEGTRLGGAVVERGPALRRQRHAAAGHGGELAHPGRGGASCCGRAASACEPRADRSTASLTSADRCMPARSRPMDNRRSAAMPWHGADPGNTEPLLTREWLVTNGLGGYASGTVAGVATRRYHGLLIAALPAPLGRTDDAQPPRRADPPARRHASSASAARSAPAARCELHGAGHLTEFRLEAACRSGATRSTASSSKSGSCSSTGRTPSTSTTGWSRATGRSG